jgi:hypothetical protein
MGPSEHSYHRGIAPMLWVFVGLAGIELVVVHLLLMLVDWRIGAVVSAISLGGVVWLVLAIRSFRAMPVRIAGDRLALRVGRIAGLDVPIANVAGVRESWESGAHKASGVLNLALIAYPNVMIDLVEPMARRRRVVRAVAHRMDDPVAFVAALAEARMAS